MSAVFFVWKDILISTQSTPTIKKQVRPLTEQSDDESRKYANFFYFVEKKVGEEIIIFLIFILTIKQALERSDISFAQQKHRASDSGQAKT